MKGAYRSIITWLGVATISGLVLACQETTPAAPAPDSDPPMPTLVGTWEQVTEWDDDDGDIRPVTIRLVLTENGKAFWHVDQLELSGEDRHDPYGHFARWNATEDTITKTFFHDDDDDNRWESSTIDKSYYLSDSGSVLFVHHWESDEAEDGFERYTRVQDPVPSNPTLLGTWESVGVYHEHDDLVDDYVVAGKRVNTLTFTQSRYILVETPYDGDEVVDYWHSSGRWTPAMEGIVTKTFAERHEDDIEEKSFDKEYAWGAGGELFIIGWDDDPDAGETQRPHIERYTRVADPLPDGLTGVWTYDGEWDRREDLGYIIDQHWMFTFGEDGVFTEVYRSGPLGTDEFGYFTVNGTWRHDDADPNFILVAVENATYQEPDGTLHDLRERWMGATMRYAYAPTDSPDVITVSTRVAELTYDEDAGMWVDNMDNPYGDYWMRLSRQQ